MSAEDENAVHTAHRSQVMQYQGTVSAPVQLQCSTAPQPAQQVASTTCI